MEHSLQLARFVGPYLIVVGGGLLLNLTHYQSIFEEFFKQPVLVYVTGLITFVTGLAMILFHNVWVSDWRVVLTLLAWNVCIKGVLLVVVPRVLATVAAAFMKNMRGVALLWTIMLGIGIFLSVKGYGG